MILPVVLFRRLKRIPFFVIGIRFDHTNQLARIRVHHGKPWRSSEEIVPFTKMEKWLSDFSRRHEETPVTIMVQDPENPIHHWLRSAWMSGEIFDTLPYDTDEGTHTIHQLTGHRNWSTLDQGSWSIQVAEMHHHLKAQND